jgi:hypothetical protein
VPTVLFPRKCACAASTAQEAAQGARTCSQEKSSGLQPSWWGSRYTIPQRDTVAGEAAARSPTSKIIDMVPDIWMISEFGKHSCNKQ